MIRTTHGLEESGGYQPGDRVKVIGGPFENFEGVVDAVAAEKGTIRVILEIFGRPTPTEIEWWQVARLQ